MRNAINERANGTVVHRADANKMLLCAYNYSLLLYVTWQRVLDYTGRPINRILKGEVSCPLSIFQKDQGPISIFFFTNRSVLFSLQSKCS